MAKVIDSREKIFRFDNSFRTENFKDYPKSDMIMPSTFMLADVYYNNIKNYEKSLFYFKKFTNEYPSHSQTAYSIYFSGFIYNNHLLNLDSAELYYKKFIKEFPNHELTHAVKKELIFIESMQKVK